MLDAQFVVPGFRLGEKIAGANACAEVDGEVADPAGDARADGGLFLGEEGAGDGEGAFEWTAGDGSDLNGLGREGFLGWGGIRIGTRAGAGEGEGAQSDDGQDTCAYHRSSSASHGQCHREQGISSGFDVPGVGGSEAPVP